MSLDTCIGSLENCL